MEKVILFESTRHAIRAEKLLKEVGFKIKVIPTPRKYSSNCGVSISFPAEDAEKIAAYLKEKAVPFAGPLEL
jgi:uncharacterized SAM-binding protein YcdF (DUF218 family)